MQQSGCMLDSLRNGLEFQIMLVIIATAVIAMLIVAAATWGWWKLRQLTRRGRGLGWAPLGRGGELTVHHFAGSSDAGTPRPPSKPEVTEETGAGWEEPPALAGRPPDDEQGSRPTPTTAPRSETRELFEEARRYATARARRLGERLRPEIDRAQQRLEQSEALRDAAARLRSMREAWDRPASGTTGARDRGASDAEGLARRLDDVLAEQRTMNELLRELLERLNRN
jgi:hypothetical protein